MMKSYWCVSTCVAILLAVAPQNARAEEAIVEKVKNEIRAQCSASVNFKRGFVSIADLNGDGVPDYIFDYGATDCPSSTFCGSGGCQVDIYTSQDSGYKKIFSNAIQGWSMKQEKGQLRVTLDLHGSECGKPGYMSCKKKLSVEQRDAPPPAPAPIVANTPKPVEPQVLQSPAAPEQSRPKEDQQRNTAGADPKTPTTQPAPPNPNWTPGPNGDRSVEHAFYLCKALDATKLSSAPCSVSGWGSSVTTTMDMTSAEARKTCEQISQYMKEMGRKFSSNWTLHIKSPYSGDNAIAYCGLN